MADRNIEIERDLLRELVKCLNERIKDLKDELFMYRERGIRDVHRIYNLLKENKGYSNVLGEVAKMTPKERDEMNKVYAQCKQII